MSKKHPDTYRQLMSSRQAGQGMVEFALILPLLLGLMLGAIEFGRLLTIYNGVSNASREAARYGAVSGDSNATQAGTQYHYLDCAGMRAAARRTAILTTLSDSDIVIAYEKSNASGGFDSIGDCVQDTQPGQSIQNGYRVVVTITTTYSPIVPLVPIPSKTFTFAAARTIFPNIVSIQCSDNEDNDSDGQTDYPNDPGCATAADTDETTTNSTAACYPLSIAIAPAGAGAFLTNPASDSDCPSGQFSDFVVITAVPNTGYKFVSYSGDVGGTNPAVTLSMTASRNITANFGPICYSLSTSVSPAGAGLVVVPTAPNCDDNSDGVNDSFTSGYAVTVQAAPACERTFGSWTGEVGTIANLNASPTTLTIDGNKAITANFTTTSSYTLDYGVTDGDFSGSNDGTAGATANDCPGGKYTQEISVTVSANPLPGYAFEEWTSDTSGSNFVSADNPYSFAMAGNTTIYAQFDNTLCHRLQIDVVTNGGGTGGSVVANPASSVSCAAGYYPNGTSIILSASATAGYSLSPGWSGGGCSGTGTTCTVLLAGDTTVTATFTHTCYTLTSAVTPAAGGSVAYSPASSSGCSAGQFYYNTSVKLTPGSATSYYFSSWSGALSGGSNPAYLTMPASNTTVTARFNKSCVTKSNAVQLSTNTIAVNYSNYTGSSKNITKLQAAWFSSTNQQHLQQVEIGTSPNWSTLWLGNPHTFHSADSVTSFSGNTGLLDGITKTMRLRFDFTVTDYIITVTTWFNGTAACS